MSQNLIPDTINAQNGALAIGVIEFIKQCKRNLKNEADFLREFAELMERHS